MNDLVVLAESEKKRKKIMSAVQKAVVEQATIIQLHGSVQ
jgi:hypothetical protein